MAGIFDDSIYAEELKLERDAVEGGVARYRRLKEEAIERGEGSALRPAERLLLHWYESLCRAISLEKQQVFAGQPGVGRLVYAPILAAVDTDKLAVITMHEAIGLCLANPYGVTVVKLSRAIGRAINAEINLPKIRADVVLWDELIHTDREHLKVHHINRIANRAWEKGRIPITAQTHVGAALINLLLPTASLSDHDQPFKAALERFKLIDAGKAKEAIRLTEPAVDQMNRDHAFRETLRPRYQPMIVPPFEWSNENRGGYLQQNIRATKWSYSTPNPLDAADLTTVYEGINALNSTAWRVNRRILDVVKALWESGGMIAGLPRRSPIPKPPLPATWDTDPAAKKEWKKEVRELRHQNAVELSDRINFGLKLSVAERFVDRGRIFFPHQMDFRGRLYTLPLHLSHQGDDIARGLLEFADGKELGKRGLQWLSIHLANSCGHDKLPFDQRSQWVWDNIDTIQGWAADPLENTGWMEADKPFQALAVAFELSDVAAPSVMPFLSHVPVQMDGTCNGLQHYAALGRDEHGAAQVNLLPGDEPADIYTDVAKRVADIVSHDSHMGLPEAVVLNGKITRQIVKRPTMTSVYGVTAVGARRQIVEELKAAGFDADDAYPCSSYLAGITLRAVKGACPGAARLMDWLRTCARLIAKSGQPVAWTNPLGLPVIQPYRNYTRQLIKTVLQKIKVGDAAGQVAIRRQVNGFAPNFIHSIDASHLLCSAVACCDRGIAFSFGAVHDSYWTHACDADTLATVLREQFIEIHRGDLIEQLNAEIRSTYPDLRLPTPPLAGSLDLTVVSNSTYFFS